MPDDGSAQDAAWPRPAFTFTIDLGDGQHQGFAEVTGLESEVKPIEYRDGDSAVFSTVKMPGISKVGNVTLKKGVFTGDSTFWAWFDQTRLTIERRTVIINLLDERGAPVMTWTLNNAFPVKMQAADVRSDGGEVAIETLEIAYETLAVKAS